MQSVFESRDLLPRIDIQTGGADTIGSGYHMTLSAPMWLVILILNLAGPFRSQSRFCRVVRSCDLVGVECRLEVTSHDRARY